MAVSISPVLSAVSIFCQQAAQKGQQTQIVYIGIHNAFLIFVKAEAAAHGFGSMLHCPSCWRLPLLLK